MIPKSILLVLLMLSVNTICASPVVLAIHKRNTGCPGDNVKLEVIGWGTHLGGVYGCTSLHPIGDNFWLKAADYNGDGMVDLIAVKRWGTGSGHTELHVYDGNNLNSAIAQSVLELHETQGSNWDFDMVDWNKDGLLDLVAFQKQGGSTDVHIYDSKTGGAMVHTSTGLHPTGPEFALFLKDWNNDSTPDLIALKKGETSTEIHVWSGKDWHTKFTADQTILESFGINMGLDLGRWNGDEKLDVVAFKKWGTGTPFVEIHVLNGNNLTEFIEHAPSRMSAMTPGFDNDVVLSLTNDSDCKKCESTAEVLFVKISNDPAVKAAQLSEKKKAFNRCLIFELFQWG